MLLAPLLLLALARPQEADPRYELGWRLKALEPAWEALEDEGLRRGLLPHWLEATRCFFAGELGGAARALDAARGALPGARLSWSDALAIVPEARLVDASRTEIGLTIEAFYASPRPARFTLALGGGEPLTIERLPWHGRLAIPPAAGERRLALELVALDEPGSSGHEPGRRELRFSAAPAVEDRLLELGTALARWKGPPSLALATARGLQAWLEELAWAPRGETDVDGAALLTEAEACLAAARGPGPWTGAGAPGERRLWVPLGATSAALRVRVPAESRASERLPLVLALHGAGGSENLFFEAYGAGAIVPLCAARRWVLVAPRLDLARPLDLAALVEALAGFLPVDPARVFLVGHSMGALQACVALQARPGAFRGAALLAGAGAVRDFEAWRALPLFLAAGEEDFARPGVERLFAELSERKAERLLFRLYPATEHLTVVGAALPEVFAFFDRALANGGSER